MVSLQQNKQGQFKVTLNKDLVETLGWTKQDELYETLDQTGRSIIISKKPR